MNIIEAIEDPRFFKPLFQDLSTWHSWLVFLKALFGLPIEERKDRRLFRKCTGLKRPPGRAAREVYLIAGRRSGKSWISAIIAVFLACFKNWRPYLSPGERGHVFIVAVDKKQAGIIRGYISAILHSNKIFERMIERETSENIDLVNSISIMVKTASYRSIRGFSICVCILEEIAFFRSEESANPDREILNAIKPALATIPDSLCLSISSPYSRFGILHEMYSTHFGSTEKEAPLIWKSDSLTMNPSLDKEIIRTALKEDFASAQAEWLGEFRQDLERFLSLELLEAATIEGRVELPRIEGVKYFAFTDSSSGILDSFALGISHMDERTGKILLDCIREIKPPFQPSSAIRELANIIKSYGVNFVVGDKFALGFVREIFQDNSIMFQSSELTTSENYLNFLPLISNLNVEILDNKRLIRQLQNLERRCRSGGRDIVDHPPGGHDDVAVAAAGACLLASRTDSFRLPLASLGYSESEKSLTQKLDRESRLWLLGKKIKKDEPEIDESFWKINEMSALDILHEVENFDKKNEKSIKGD